MAAILAGVAVISAIFFSQLSSAAPHSFATVEPGLRQALTAQHVPLAAQDSTIAMARDCYVDTSRERDSSVVLESCVMSGYGQPTQVVTGPPTYTINAGTLYVATKEANATNLDHAFRWSVVYDTVLLAVTFGLSFALPKRFHAEAYQEM